MDTFAEFIKILLPASLVLYGMYLTVSAFLTRETERRQAEVKLKNADLVTPVRLQAYERVCLLLERVSPHHLVLRVNNPAYNVAQLQQQLVASVREEYAHNLTQQMYVSDQAWLFVKNATEEVIGMVNSAAETKAPDEPGVALAKAIFEQLVRRPEDPTQRALRYVKEEIRRLF